MGMRATTDDTMLVQMTWGQLGEEIERRVAKVISGILPPAQPKPRVLAHSLKEFAAMVGVHPTTIQRWKNSGALDGALIQYGHTVVVDVEMAMQQLGEAGKAPQTADTRKARHNNKKT